MHPNCRNWTWHRPIPSAAATLITLTPGVYSIEAEVSGYEEKNPAQLELFTTDEQAFEKLGSLEIMEYVQDGSPYCY